eukprot:gene17027-8535_t
MASCQSEKFCDVTQISEQPEGLEKDAMIWSGYYTAYNYVLNEDLKVEFSRGHPKKVMKPRTPFIINATLQHPMKKYEQLDPEHVKLMLDSFYGYDLSTSVNTVEEATSEIIYNIDLHGLADASMKALGACLYAVYKREREVKLSTLVTGKSTVDPVDPVDPVERISIPRGAYASSLEQHEKWYQGPAWLRLPEHTWPPSPENFEPDKDALIETRPNCELTLLTKQTNRNLSTVINVRNFSIYNKLLRVTALVLRFIDNLKAKVRESEVRDDGSNDYEGIITVGDVNNTWKLWILEIQHYITSNKCYSY